METVIKNQNAEEIARNETEYKKNNFVSVSCPVNCDTQIKISYGCGDSDIEELLKILKAKLK